MNLYLSFIDIILMQNYRKEWSNPNSNHLWWNNPITFGPYKFTYFGLLFVSLIHFQFLFLFLFLVFWGNTKLYLYLHVYKMFYSFFGPEAYKAYIQSNININIFNVSYLFNQAGNKIWTYILLDTSYELVCNLIYYK